MASHNPSGKPDMMPFPGVHSVRRGLKKVQSYQCGSSKKILNLLLALTQKLQPSTMIILFFAESELLAGSYNSKSKMQDCQKIFSL